MDGENDGPILALISCQAITVNASVGTGPTMVLLPDGITAPVTLIGSTQRDEFRGSDGNDTVEFGRTMPNPGAYAHGSLGNDVYDFTRIRVDGGWLAVICQQGLPVPRREHTQPADAEDPGGQDAHRFEFWRDAGWNRVADFDAGEGGVLALGRGMWTATNGVLTAPQLVSTFGRINATGDAVLDFSAEGITLGIVGAGMLDGLADYILIL